jgi:small-conductance mechanosensitive channel
LEDRTPLLGNWIELVGPHQAVRIFGVTLVGVNAENGRKLLFTICFIVLIWALRKGLRGVLRLIFPGREHERAEFWAKQFVVLFTAALLIVGVVSIWFDDPTRLTTAFGLVTAGLAFALQRVVTAIAAYFVLLRGRTFNVGDRIKMGGVRGDVINLTLITTTIMEMGQPPGEQGDSPSMWVHSRQYTGRVVSVTNDKIFDEPVYNYTREFPFVWEEMQIPISFKDDRKRVEQILLEVADRHTVKIAELSEEQLQHMESQYLMRRAEIHPRVYWRITDNWVELTLRFIAHDDGVRALKDAMSREILEKLDAAGIGIASSTYDVVGMPKLHVHIENPSASA